MTVPCSFDRRALWLIAPALLLVLLAFATTARGTPPPAGYGKLAASAQLADAGPAMLAAPDAGGDKGLGSSPSIDWAKVVLVGGALWTALSGIVALTPTKRDDAWLAATAQRLSFLRAPNAIPGLFGILSLPGTRPRPNPEGV